MDWFWRTCDALAFLSRLVPPHNSGPQALTRAVPCFALAGLILGLVCALPVWLFFQYSTAPAPVLQAVLGAWLWLVLELWCTRGLHWDGLADLADACGSGQSGDRFWAILRDSRMGAFGGLSLVVVFCGYAAALSWHLAAGHWLQAILAPAWGRACALWLAGRCPAREAQSLGGLMAAGVSPTLCRVYTAGAAGLLLLLVWHGLPCWQALALSVAQYWLVRRLASVAQAQGGLSGDFLGAAIVLGQLCFLLFTL